MKVSTTRPEKPDVVVRMTWDESRRLLEFLDDTLPAAIRMPEENRQTVNGLRGALFRIHHG